MEAPVPALSPRSLERQIAREGERWGLVPETDPRDGKTRVCEVRPQAEARYGVGEVVRRGDMSTRICTVNDDAPFSEALRNRVANGERDLARRYRLLDDEERRARLVQEEEQRKETARIWGSRNRITVLPTGVVPAGLANRRGR